MPPIPDVAWDAAVGGRYDPSWSSVTDDDDDLFIYSYNISFEHFK